MSSREHTWTRRLFRWWCGSRRGAGDELGATGEREAERFLTGRGYQAIGRNLRFRAGEIDLLMLAPDEKTIVIVEVKSRSGSHGVYTPEAAITRDKQATLRRLAGQVRSANGWKDRPIRIDVVAVELSRDGHQEVRHHEAAVRA